MGAVHLCGIPGHAIPCWTPGLRPVCPKRRCPGDRPVHGLLRRALPRPLGPRERMGTLPRNPTAPFYLRQGCGETCYDKTPEGWRYEGLQRGLLTTFAPVSAMSPGTSLPSPASPSCPTRHRAWRSGAWPPTCTERWGTSGFPMTSPTSRSLVFSTPKGLVIFNSCCHGARTTSSGKWRHLPWPAHLRHCGGFHLYDTPRPGGPGLRPPAGETRVTQVITGHCTGPEALDILTQVLGQPGAAPLHRVGAGL